ncbi:MAG: outer membrane beta-barrel protein [Bacteroidaceae bacterium]|nr:outer membrane beta-barrel protein [Bacteroidaceae bacterium]
MRPKLLTLLFTFCAIVAQAQTFSVKGLLFDSETKGAIPMVKVQLLTTDSAQVDIATTNDDGAFVLRAKSAGKYIVRTNMIGYESLTKQVSLTSQKAAIDLGKLALKATDIQLSEAQVTALSRMMTMKEDTLVFHSSALRLPPGASLATLMNQLPGVSIDKDGNLTFQGKAVSQILVDGKPFFGDVNTALANMPTDAVQDVKVYEKTDEEKEFRGELDEQKATVVDLKIKKEYKSTWMTNLNLGGGTDKRYIGKFFTTNFTDKRRTAIYAQMNNISQNQRVDENGNWRYWSGTGGVYTYRKAGAMLQWDNGKGNKEAGNLRTNMNVEVAHNDQTSVMHNNSETFLGGSKSLFNYAHSSNFEKDIRTNINGQLTYNIDSLNRINLSARYSYNNYDEDSWSKSSTYHTQPDITEGLAESLLGNTIDETLKQKGVYSNYHSGLGDAHYHNASLDAKYTHLFKKKGRTLDFSLGAGYRENNNEAHQWQEIRYFQTGVAEPERLVRRYGLGVQKAYNLDAGINYVDRLTEHIKMNASYRYVHAMSRGNENLYNLDRYAAYRDPYLPLGHLPTAGDSLEYTRDSLNSQYSREYNDQHSLRISMSGQWEKWEAMVYPSLNLFHDRIYMERGGNIYEPKRTHLGLGLYSYVKYNINKQNYLELNYNGRTSRPSLSQLLPISDTSDPMSETIYNPDLKAGWANSVDLYGRFFNTKRGDTYSVSLGIKNQSNTQVSTRQTDPNTGYTRYSYMNVNGDYSTWGSAWTEQPLDTARCWMLTASARINYSHNTGYVGTIGDELGLSAINRILPHTGLGLRYRKDIWSISLNGSWSGDYTRYKTSPLHNQNGHTYEVSLTPQVDLPFGMKINTNLIYYTRTGYADDLLNHDQWILNASISQSFLKSKALTLQLEAVDLLKQRTSEFNHLTAGGRYFNRTECFLSYIMLHATYKFNIGGKK